MGRWPSKAKRAGSQTPRGPLPLGPPPLSPPRLCPRPPELPPHLHLGRQIKLIPSRSGSPTEAHVGRFGGKKSWGGEMGAGDGVTWTLSLWLSGGLGQAGPCSAMGDPVEGSTEPLASLPGGHGQKLPAAETLPSAPGSLLCPGEGHPVPRDLPCLAPLPFPELSQQRGETPGALWRCLRAPGSLESSQSEAGWEGYSSAGAGVTQRPQKAAETALGRPHILEAGVLGGGVGRAVPSRGLPPGLADGRVLPVPTRGHPSVHSCPSLPL